MAPPVKRKIYLKPSKETSISEENFQELELRKIDAAVSDVLNSKLPKQSYEELYRSVENLFINNHALLLQENLLVLLEHNLLSKAEDILNTEEDKKLEIIEEVWKQFCKQIKIIRNIFLSLDRSSKVGKYNFIQISSFGLFKKLIILNPEIGKSLLNNLLNAIDKDRNGGHVNIKLLNSLICMISEIQIYEEIFHPMFIKNSEIYYTNEGNRFIKLYDIKEYLRFVDIRIQDEKKRMNNYLNKYSSSSLLETLYKSLIGLHMREILDKGFENLMEQNSNTDLLLMYKLFENITCGIKILVEYFTNYIFKKGLAIVNNTSKEKNIIKDLLDFKDKLDTIIVSSFDNNEAFQQEMRSKFIKFVNVKENKPAQLLAKYIDSKLRCKEISEEELEKLLGKVMVLFRFIQGKDIFEAFYKRDAAKRLLLGKSTSQDAEDSMVSKLKLECGGEFTSKIEGMFNDIGLSRSINAGFKQYLTHLDENSSLMGSDFSINVLTSSYWPNYPNYNVNLPPDLANYQNVFQKFYTASHSGRKLLWQPSLGHCVVKASFESGNKELQVSLFQTVILLLFNNYNKLSYKEIQEATNLEVKELQRTLISLACGKARVLLKQPKGKDIQDDDFFIFNSKFTDKLFRVRINQIQLKETIEEEKATENSVLVDRQFQIDAAIVRIMKNKKTINHNTLIAELFNTLNYPVKQSDLKKRIELLIERDYMERNKNNSSIYVYIA